MNRKPPDFGLWDDVASSVKPLRKRKPSSPSPMRGGIKGGGLAVPPEKKLPRKREEAKPPPPITGFDRRTAQKMTRGNVEIERRLDLHGTGVEMARVRLLQFLHRAHGDRVRTVLIITGKGASPFSSHTLHGASHFHSPERQGRLRRLLPGWLNEPEFRILVSGFQPAHPRHGGGGAYYVKLRRAK